MKKSLIVLTLLGAYGCGNAVEALDGQEPLSGPAAQAVRVVPQQLIEDLGARRLAESGSPLASLGRRCCS